MGDFDMRALYRVAATLVAVLTAGGLAACSGAQQNLSERDQLDKQRDGALAVFLNRKVTDRIDAGAGDNIDWKFVEVPDPGTLKVGVAFDNPEQVEGHVILRDNFATVIERQRLTGERALYAFEPVEARRGRYYVEIEATSGRSVYTVGAKLEEPDVGEFATEEVDLERIDKGGDRGGGRRVRGVGRGRTRTPKPDKETKQKPPEESPEDDEQKEPEEEPGTVQIAGNIERVIPLDDGGALLTVSLRGSSRDLVGPGSQGTINGMKASVVVRRRSGNYVTVFTKADPESIGTQRTVTFSVKP